MRIPAPWPLVSCALLLALLVACSGEERLEPGVVTPAARTADLSGVRAEVWLPTGRLRMVITKGRSSVDGVLTDSGESLRAAEGEELHGVAWQLDRGLGQPRPSLLRNHRAESDKKPVTVSVVRDGERTTLKETDDSGWKVAAWVPVAAGETFMIEVAFDGLTQTVDPRTGKVAPSVASAYSRVPVETRDATCHDLNDDLMSDNYMHCFVDFESGLPHVPGIGWAAPGNEFVVVEVRTDAAMLRDERALTDEPGATTLDKESPVAVLEDQPDTEGDRGARSRLLVFEVPDAAEHELAVEVTFTAERGSPPLSFTGKGTATLIEKASL
ncbi:hypothetical protein BJ980_003058 [Nocardioides daedukensis]|uniref:Uncharacterized protein n=1 Tax=Nocardioides daedukensis TaxID=634462 RepID=A0A7Y9UW19_9ACTN|nr:hypothetical protein [Nocardioides daedukensis]NYG60135.1 hypothetical protein [Nocardioides daedukensis]